MTDSSGQNMSEWMADGKAIPVENSWCEMLFLQGVHTEEKKLKEMMKTYRVLAAGKGIEQSLSITGSLIVCISIYSICLCAHVTWVWGDELKSSLLLFFCSPDKTLWVKTSPSSLPVRSSNTAPIELVNMRQWSLPGLAVLASCNYKGGNLRWKVAAC